MAVENDLAIQEIRAAWLPARISSWGRRSNDNADNIGERGALTGSCRYRQVSLFGLPIPALVESGGYPYGQLLARTSSAGGGSITVQASSNFFAIRRAVSQRRNLSLLWRDSWSRVLRKSNPCHFPCNARCLLPTGACTGGGSSCSTAEPNTVLLTLSAPDKPHYKTGTYSAQITFTISTL